MNENNSIRIRYFYDYSSGVCLWAGNRYTSELLGYPIESDNLYLCLDPNLIGEMERMILLYDGSLNWSSPLDDSPWTHEEWESFYYDSRRLFSRILKALPRDYEIVDEVNYP